MTENLDYLTDQQSVVAEVQQPGDFNLTPEAEAVIVGGAALALAAGVALVIRYGIHDLKNRSQARRQQELHRLTEGRRRSSADIMRATGQVPESEG